MSGIHYTSLLAVLGPAFVVLGLAELVFGHKVWFFGPFSIAIGAIFIFVAISLAKRRKAVE